MAISPIHKIILLTSQDLSPNYDPCDNSIMTYTKSPLFHVYPQ